MDYIKRILPLCKSILWLVSEVKANKKRCRRLAERVKGLEELVESISKKGPGQISSTVNQALWQLCMTLTRAQELVTKCKSRFPNLMKCKSEFNSVNKSLYDSFQVLSGALQVEQGNRMRRMFQDYTLDEDDDDWGDGFGPSSALVPLPLSGAMAPTFLPAPRPYFDPRPQPTTSVFAAMMVVEDGTSCYTEAIILEQ